MTKRGIRLLDGVELTMLIARVTAGCRWHLANCPASRSHSSVVNPVAKWQMSSPPLLVIN